MRTTRILLALLFLCYAGAASAGEKNLATLGFKVGGAFHSVFSALDPTVAFEVDGGILLAEERLEVGVSVGYARPPASHAASDPRLAAGSFDWNLTQEVLTLGLGIRYRLALGKTFWLYGGAGPRIYLLRTTVNGSSGDAAFGEYQQFDTEVGGVLSVGGEFGLGPGRAVLELQLGLGGLKGLVTGQVASSNVGAVLGYRLLF